MNGPSEICGRQPLKNLKYMVCLGRPYHFKLFKGYVPQILFGPFLNILTQTIFCISFMVFSTCRSATSADVMIVINNQEKIEVKFMFFIC